MTAKSTKSKTNRKKTGTTSKKSTSNKKTTKKNTKKTTRSTRTAKSGNSFLMDEILIWITLAVSIILLISNFGVAGFLGDAVSGVLWEIFGAVAYIIPFVLFGLVSFQVSNKGNRYAYMKTVIAVLLLFLAEILLQLVDELGGKIGKGLASVLTPAIGVAGTYVVTVILMIICLVIITGKSALKGVKAVIKHMQGQKKMQEDIKSMQKSENVNAWNSVNNVKRNVLRLRQTAACTGGETSMWKEYLSIRLSLRNLRK